MNSSQLQRCARLALLAVSPGLAQDGDPFLRAHAMLSRGYVLNVVVVDVDADGDPDVASYDDLVLLNDGDGRLVERGSLPRSLLNRRFADVDGDGAPDLLEETSYTRSESRWVVRLNDGAGSFGPPGPELAYPAVGPIPVDLDGDGDVDLFGWGDGIRRSAVHRNDGAGTFVEFVGAIPTGLEAKRVVLQDFDGDGDTDAFQRTPGPTYYAEGHRLLLNDGSGRFALAPVQPSSALAIGTFVPGDLDADGDIDLLTGIPPHRFLNDGTGVFADGGQAFPVPVGDVTLADVDGDGDADSLASLPGGDRGLWINDGSGNFAQAPFEFARVSTGASQFVVFDADDDDDVDLLLPASDQRLYLNDGTGSFTDVTWPEHERLLFLSFNFGDLDGDGFLDLVGCDGTAGQLMLAVNDGTGGFGDRRVLVSTRSRPCRELVLADFDEDGDLDILAALHVATGRHVLALYVDEGGGTFVDASSNLSADRIPGHQVALADVDGDAHIDVLVANTHENRLLLGDGEGRFEDATMRWATTPQPTSLLLVGDVDGDGDVDVFEGGGSQGGDRLLLNDGTGAFEVAVGALPVLGPGGARAAAFADLDGDGDLDLAIEGDDKYLLVNDGTGGFSPGTTVWEVLSPSNSSSQLLPLDFDLDGDVDLAGSGSRLWRNDGVGNLEDLSDLLPEPEVGRFFGAADVDLDGDTDLVVSPAVVRANAARHLAWRSVPRVGKPLTMDVRGPAGTGWSLFASPGRVPPRATDRGVLSLPAVGTRLVASGTLDANGHAAWRALVPPDPGLVGRELWWQALDGDPARWTNLERTRLTGL